MEYMFALAFGILLAAQVSTPNDFLVVAGQRAGPITAETTHADLLRIFGKERVQDEGPEDVGEGNFQRVTILNRTYPSGSATILWTDGDLQKRVFEIRFCTYATGNCSWHTREQISRGTSLRTIEKLNGIPFTMSGFDWDYGGTILSFGNGRLSYLKHGCGSIILRLPPRHPKPAQAQRGKHLEDQLQGDRDFSSAHPAMRELNPEVGEMDMEFSDCTK